MFAVSTSLIRYWESEFPHLAPKKNNRGDRRYTRKEIEDIGQIFSLVKEKGYTLQGAKDFLINKQDKKNMATVDTLLRLKALLQEIRDKLPEA